MFNKVLVGYAGEEAGRDAAALGALLAEACGAELIVAFPYHPLLSTISSEVAEAQVRDELRGLLGDRGPIEEAAYRWSNASWPTRALHELAEFIHADVIVIGATPQGSGHRQVGLMGRIVHGAPCAVALAPSGYGEPAGHELSTIGVGFTNSAEGRAAIVLGDELAGAEGAELRIIAGSGLEPALAAYAFSSPSLPLVEDELYEETKETAERVTADLVRQEDCRLDVRRGDPSRVLVEASKSLDLLVLGSRAYGPVRHVLLGSVSAAVMRTAHCPVLVMPRSAVDSRSEEHSDATSATLDV